MKKSDLKKDLEAKKPIFGLNVCTKKIKIGEIKKVYISSNCLKRDEIKKYCKLFDVELVEMKENNYELGVLCKKPFSIGVLCFEK